MDNQQAIEVLSDFDKQASAKADGAYQTTIGKMACDLAIEALEKRIPKKPIRVLVGHNGSSTDGCANCKREFYETFTFCPDCGQAIDWN